MTLFEEVRSAGGFVHDNRSRFTIVFPSSARPSPELIRQIKAEGFRWNRSQVAWTRSTHYRPINDLDYDLGY